MANAAILVCIGGANLDLSVQSRAAIVPNDSNPAAFSFSVGGVARNICENAVRLGLNGHLLAAVGDDPFGEMILGACRTNGIDISAVKTAAGRHSSVYFSAHDPAGEMAVAFSDMTVAGALCRADLQNAIPLLRQAKVICCDANPSAAFLNDCAALLSPLDAPLFLDPVSTAHCAKLHDCIGAFHTVKPNRLELAALTGCGTADDAALQKAAALLIDRGVRRVFVSLGERGVFYLDAEGNRRRCTVPPLPMQSATGGGDAFAGSLAASWAAGHTLEETLRRACAAAALTVQHPQTVNPMLNQGAIDKWLGENEVCISN